MSIAPPPDPRNAEPRDPLTATIYAAVEDAFAKHAPHLRSDDDYLPLDEAAQLVGLRGKSPARALRDAGKRGEIRIDHAGKTPVVQRAELRRWVSARPISVAAPFEDVRAAARKSIADAAARIGGDR